MIHPSLVNFAHQTVALLALQDVLEEEVEWLWFLEKVLKYGQFLLGTFLHSNLNVY